MIKKFFTLITLFCILLISCSKNEQTSLESISSVLVTDSEISTEELNSVTQTWHQTNECVCVLFGYGYNDLDFVNKTKAELYKQFGSYEEGGYVFCLVYPEDFKKGSKTHITNLENELNDKNVKGIILLGAPENTHKAIARMQDKADGKLNFPVFSFFSQDDIVATEDTSDFVLDKAQKATEKDILNEEAQSFVQETPELLKKAIEYSILSDNSFTKDEKLFNFVKMITSSMPVKRYIDPETNLTSINHFVLE